MQITREDLNPCTVKLNIVCDQTEVHGGFEKAKKNLSKNLKLPGFRPGKAPRHMVEQLLNKATVYDEALQNIIGATYKNSLKEQNLEPDPTVRPQLEVTKIDENECEYNAKIGLMPIVELGDMKGIPIQQPAVSITPEDIDKQVDELRQRRGTHVAITERGVAEGDVCVINIKLDGEEGDARTFMIIAGKTFPTLDAALMNMRVEEVKHVALDFPENFQEKDWAGKSNAGIVTLNSVSAVSLPELDDAFAQSLKTEGVEDLRNRIKSGMENAVKAEIDKIVSEQLLDGLLERSKVEVSDNMWEPIADQRLAEVAEEQKKSGKTLDDYAEQQGMSLEDIRNSWRDRAKTEVRKALLVREIYKKEDMKLNDEDLNIELADMSREVGVTPEQMFKLLDEQNAINELQFRAISRKVREFLAAQADVKEMAVSAGA